MSYNRKNSEEIKQLQKELPELECRVSYGGFHMYKVFQDDTKKKTFIAICERCLKTKKVDLTEK